MKRFLIAVAVIICSMPAWAGNYYCQVNNSLGGGQYSTPIGGHGPTAWQACQDAAKEACYGNPNVVLHNAACAPWPLDQISPDQVCTDSTCTSAANTSCVGPHIYGTSAPPQARIDFGMCVAGTVTRISGGTNWGPQYGSPRTYDSVADSTPDVITYIGPEDGNASIEIDANQGVNSTAISSVSVTNSFGTPILAVSHHSTNPDVWFASGSVAPLSSYNVNVTFSHVGGYGEYAVKMAASGIRPQTYAPILTFGGNNSGMVYTSAGNYSIVGNIVHSNVTISVTNKGSSTGLMTASLPTVITDSSPGACTSMNVALISTNTEFSYAEVCHGLLYFYNAHWLSDTDVTAPFTIQVQFEYIQ